MAASTNRREAEGTSLREESYRVIESRFLALDEGCPLDWRSTQIFTTQPKPLQMTLLDAKVACSGLRPEFADRTWNGCAADTVIVQVRSRYGRRSHCAQRAGRAVTRDRRVSICTGAFALPAADYCAGRTRPRPWKHIDELRPRTGRGGRPTISTSSQAMLTSAGYAAASTCITHLDARDLGVVVAGEIAHAVSGRYRTVELMRWLPSRWQVKCCPVPTGMGPHRLSEPLLRDLAPGTQVSWQPYASFTEDGRPVAGGLIAPASAEFAGTAGNRSPRVGRCWRRTCGLERQPTCGYAFGAGTTPPPTGAPSLTSTAGCERQPSATELAGGQTTGRLQPAAR